eukprot:c10527_g1_i2.p2 GENE.c10527_g1_i2~~c10527_g1_i2.p2  ORF type:complete len:174 (+),score=40.61 c10527_g1_i2:62-523(+)
MDAWLDSMGLAPDATEPETVEGILALCKLPAAVEAAREGLEAQGVSGEAGAAGLFKLENVDALEKVGLERLGHRWAIWEAILEANSKRVRANLAAAGWTMARAVDKMDDETLLKAGIRCGAQRWAMTRALAILKAELAKVSVRDGVAEAKCEE